MARWQIGDKILNRYEVYDIKGGPGVSGWGIVYVCYDHKGRIPLAVKTFQDSFLLDLKVRDNFTKEALTWISLDRHMNIVKAEWVLEIEGRPYIFLEYVAGEDLQGWLGTKRVDLITALNFAAQFCNGMEYAFKKVNLVHRDIKPSNVLISKDRTVKIGDFGLAKAVIGAGAENLGTPTSGQVFTQSHPAGYVAYASPEQWTGGEIDTRADIYSFGIVLYQMISGRHPYPEIGLTWRQRHLYESPLPIEDYDIPENLKCLVFRCLEKRPDERYENFSALKEEISEIYHTISGKVVVLETSPVRLKAWELNNKAIALANLGKHSDSLKCCDKALETDPTYIDALAMKGAALGRLGKNRAALECLDKVLELDPQHVSALTNKGTYLADLGKWTEAIQSYDRALEADPDFTQALVIKGDVLRELRRFPEVIECCDRALEINPRLVDALLLKAEVLGIVGKYEESVEYCDKALNIHPMYAEVLVIKAASLGKLGKHQASVDCCDKALEITRSFIGAWVNKGVSLMSLQQYEDALRCADTALGIDPGNELAQRLRESCLQHLALKSM